MLQSVVSRNNSLTDSSHKTAFALLAAPAVRTALGGGQMLELQVTLEQC